MLFPWHLFKKWLDLTPAELKEYDQAPYMRLLGFNAKGQQVLRRANKFCVFSVFNVAAGT